MELPVPQDPRIREPPSVGGVLFRLGCRSQSRRDAPWGGKRTNPDHLGATRDRGRGDRGHRLGGSTGTGPDVRPPNVAVEGVALGEFPRSRRWPRWILDLACIAALGAAIAGEVAGNHEAAPARRSTVVAPTPSPVARSPAMSFSPSPPSSVSR